jgi:hypothetical protein
LINAQLSEIIKNFNGGSLKMGYKSAVTLNSKITDGMEEVSCILLSKARLKQLFAACAVMSRLERGTDG